MTMIVKAALHIRLDLEEYSDQGQAAATDGVGEILRSEDMRLNSDKNILIDWTGADAIGRTVFADDRTSTADFLAPIELYLNVELPDNDRMRQEAALAGLSKVLDAHLHNPERAPESCLISYTIFDVRPAVRYDEAYMESDAWAFPEYRAAFLEEFPGKVTDDLERYIEDQFFADQMTAQKAARAWINNH